VELFVSKLGGFLTTRFQTNKEKQMSTETVESTTVAQKSPEEISQLASEIQTRISALESLFEDDLRGEMASLKACLIENPSAAALLKDEDVGTPCQESHAYCLSSCSRGYSR
jgi:hypothetical protein